MTNSFLSHHPSLKVRVCTCDYRNVHLFLFFYKSLVVIGCTDKHNSVWSFIMLSDTSSLKIHWVGKAYYIQKYLWYGVIEKPQISHQRIYTWFVFASPDHEQWMWKLDHFQSTVKADNNISFMTYKI